MILNLTQHASTKDQKDQGVFDFEGEDLDYLHKLLTFEKKPSKKELIDRAYKVAIMAFFADGFPSAALIERNPYFMAYLEKALIGQGITPVYAFSKR